MSILSFLSSRGKATKVYKRGMDKAHHRDLDGAIEDYTLILKMSRAPEDVKAMARFNRALAHSSKGDYGPAEKDLSIVIEMPETPSNVLAAAKEKLSRMNRLKERLDEQED